MTIYIFYVNIYFCGDTMSKIIRSLPLDINGIFLRVIDDELKVLRDELDMFISDIKYMNTLKFSKSVLFSHEIQANNIIEGYKDDVETIYEVIHKCSKITDKEKKQRILNLYRGYKYILKRNDINKDNLKELYSLLSKDLLSSYDLNNMGDYYRINPVYIYYSSRMDIPPDEGIKPELIDDYMNNLLEYISNDNNLSKVELFIKSQIIHFYFVYIHPYYDINGRTSRTTSMWYLLNNQSYPFIIFNRAIQLYKNEYYKVIREAKNYSNVTFFLKYMMNHTREELEKDYIINMIRNSCNYDISTVDYQSLHYILSMRGIKTYIDFAQFYNRQNEKKKVYDIYNDMLYPLIDKKIIIPTTPTSKKIGGIGNNYNFKLNDSFYELDSSKIKKIYIK